MAEIQDPFGDVLPALIKLIEATAELAAIEGFDSVVSKLEEAVEDLHKEIEDAHVRETSTQQFLPRSD